MIIKKGDYIARDAKNTFDASHTSANEVVSVGKNTFTFKSDNNPLPIKETTFPWGRLKEFVKIAAPTKKEKPKHCAKSGGCKNVKCEADLCYHDKRD